MPRQIRVQFPGAIYHLMSRGDRREDIFLDDVDRQDFLKTLAEACRKTGFQVHAYCLMSNHFHAVIETPNVNTRPIALARFGHQDLEEKRFSSLIEKRSLLTARPAHRMG